MPENSPSPTGKITPDFFEYSAGFIVFNEVDGQRKYLVLHYPGGHFDFAKGHLEADETNLQAATRELAEETSIKEIEIVDGFEKEIVYTFRRKEGFNREQGLVEKKVTFFLAHTNHTNIKISSEHKGYLWLPYQQALSKTTFENARSVLRAAETHLQQKLKP